MKIFVIGGITRTLEMEQTVDSIKVLDSVMRDFAEAVSGAGHEAVVSSPFRESADRAFLDALKLAVGDAQQSISVEIHYPASPAIEAEVDKAITGSLGKTVHRFRHPAPVNDEKASLTNAWLFSQLYALDRCHAVLAIGGKLGGTANLLLHLAEAKRKPILAIPLLGGASEQCYWRQRFQLMDRLGDGVTKMADDTCASQWVQLLERLADQDSNQIKSTEHAAPAFFISYARARPQEADLVEMILRRRNLSVFRDERDFEPGNLIETEIFNHIRKASVFISLYSQAYACSPWCYDELQEAASLHQKGSLRLWLLTLDDTRIVLPTARDIVTIPARSRIELEAKLSKHLDRLLALP